MTSSPAPVSNRELWRRHRAPLISAMPAGAVLGAIADLAFSANTVHASPQDRIPALLVYAGTGAAFALVATAGAVVAVLLGRPRSGTAVTPFGRIAAGAGGAVFVGVLLAGTVSAAITGSWGWYSFTAVVAVVTGLVAAAGASGLTAFFQYRHRLLP